MIKNPIHRTETANNLSLKQVGAPILIPCNGFSGEHSIESRSQIPFHNEDNGVDPRFWRVLFLEL